MKKLLFSLSLVGALAAFAGESEIDASAQTFGVLTVTSGETNVIVSVPWVAATNESASTIPVADIIKTANLTAGDWVRVWDQADKRFKVWELKTGSDDVKYWECVQTVSPQGSDPGTNSVDVALKRGDALILHRQTPKDSEGNDNSFYLYGQYLSSGAESITCAKATEECTKAYTLIAPPTTTATSVNSITWENVSDDDYLTVSEGRIVYNSSATEGQRWGEWALNGKGLKATWVWSATNYQIPAGQGVWYTSTDTNETHNAVVVTWPTK